MDDGNLFPPAASQPGAIKRKALRAYESPIPTSFWRYAYNRTKKAAYPAGIAAMGERIGLQANSEQRRVVTRLRQAVCAERIG